MKSRSIIKGFIRHHRITNSSHLNRNLTKYSRGRRLSLEGICSSFLNVGPTEGFAESWLGTFFVVSWASKGEFCRISIRACISVRRVSTLVRDWWRSEVSSTRKSIGLSAVVLVVGVGAGSSARKSAQVSINRRRASYSLRAEKGLRRC